MEATSSHELLVFIFVLDLSFSVVTCVHASIIGGRGRIGKVVLDGTRESNVGSVGHEHAKMAMGSSTKWGGDGPCIVVEFKLQLTNARLGPKG